TKMDCDGGGTSGDEQYTSVDAKKREKKICHRHTPQQFKRLEARITVTQVMQIAESRAAHDERSSNILLPGENDKIQCENELVEVLLLVETNTNTISKNCIWKTPSSKRSMTNSPTLYPRTSTKKQWWALPLLLRDSKSLKLATRTELIQAISSSSQVAH
ncbi:unnamed protein product, partial [Thlaspi arvense]